MNITKNLLVAMYGIFFMSLLTKNAAIFLVLRKDQGLNKVGQVLVDNYIVEHFKSSNKQSNGKTSPVAVIQKYIGINSAYAYFAPNITEFCQLTFTSTDEPKFFLRFNDFLSSPEGKVKLGTISVLLSSPELYSVHKELFSSIVLRIFEENPKIYNLTCNINTTPYIKNRNDMIAKKGIQSKKIGFIVFKRQK
jgi:hypothetical protein